MFWNLKILQKFSKKEKFAIKNTKFSEYINEFWKYEYIDILAPLGFIWVYTFCFKSHKDKPR